MKNIYYKTESSLDNIIVEKIINYLKINCSLTPILTGSAPGKGTILKLENWQKFMNLIKNPDAILILLMDIDNDFQCVTKFFEEISIKFGDDYRKDNCYIFLSVREIEIWLMADMDGFSDFFGVPKNHIQSLLNTSEYKIKKPKEEMKNLIKKYGKKDIQKALNDPDERYFLQKQHDFMLNFWNPKNAIKVSYSLNRMVEKLKILI